METRGAGVQRDLRREERLPNHFCRVVADGETESMAGGGGREGVLHEGSVLLGQQAAE